MALDFGVFLGSDRSRAMFFNVYKNLEMQFIAQTLKVEVDLQHFKHRLLRFGDEMQQEGGDDGADQREDMEIDDCSFDESGVFDEESEEGDA